MLGSPLSARIRRVTVAIAVSVACASVASASATRSERVRVSCSNIIGGTTAHQIRAAGGRLVLGRAFVPVRLAHQAIRVPTQQRWRYWMKAGVVLRAGAGPPVEISLGRSWTNKARVMWGNGLPDGTIVQFARCGAVSKSHPWNAYAGGFYITTPSACVPLHITVGRATASVTVAIGRRCL